MNINNAYKFLSSRQYRVQRALNIAEHKETMRLRGMARGVEGSTRFCDSVFYFSDARTFIGSKEEIFNREIYKFNTSSQVPYIIDAGANVGMSVLYFKWLYPKARIIAFEPDHDLFQILNRNISSYGLDNVQTHQSALWNEDTEINFWSKGKEASRIGFDEKGNCTVKAERLSKYINGHVDMLKIDIEGSELKVLEECNSKLHLVDRLFVEYHSFENRPQDLSRLILLLEEAGFRLHIQDNLPLSNSPFCHIEKYDDMDLLLNIFAYRNSI